MKDDPIGTLPLKPDHDLRMLLQRKIRSERTRRVGKNITRFLEQLKNLAKRQCE